MNLHNDIDNESGGINEEHIMAAFTDLNRRAGIVPVDNGPHVRAGAKAPRPGFGDRRGDNRLIPALAFAVLAVLAGFSVWQLLPDSGDSDAVNVATDGDFTDDGTETDGDGSNGVIATDDGTTDGTDTTADDGTTGVPVEVEAGARYRVDTAKVAADTSDPFLNIRQRPGVNSDIVAKLPPTYRGMVATGEAMTSGDGATWIEVQLQDPVNVNLGEPLHGGLPTGWVNAGFTIRLTDGLAVGTDEVAACSSLPDESASLGGLGRTGYVYGLESGFVGGGGDCLRVVVTIAPGSTPFTWEDIPTDTGPASALPDAFVSESGGRGVTLNLGNVGSAWQGATDTDDDVYIVRGNDGNVDLVSPLPVGQVHVTPLAGAGIIVLDMEVAGEAPRTGPFVALIDEPAVGAGTVTVTGLSRPFEASLWVAIVDSNDEPVAAVYSGSSSLGTLRGTEYSVQTNDWTEAWGRFAVTASDLQPGSYTMLLDGEGGVDNPSFTRVPFTITDGPSTSPSEPSADEQADAQALVRFAQGGSLADVNLANEVTLSLGLAHQETFTRAELENRDNWTLDFEPFAGRTGPFDMLGILADGQVSFSTGSIPHCASPALDWPTEWGALSQVNIEPVGATSCLEWYGVSLFRNNSGEVEVIVLDLFEP